MSKFEESYEKALRAAGARTQALATRLPARARAWLSQPTTWAEALAGIVARAEQEIR